MNNTDDKSQAYYFHPLTGTVIGCAIEVHRHLGPGLLESMYEECLAYELRQAGVPFTTQQRIPVRYKGVTLSGDYRLDFLVDQTLIVELKVVSELIPLYQAQLLTYMKLAHIRIGLLINFNEAILRHGLRRLIL